jgi:diguanylate cyclase (GGDEF)-like protein
MQMSPTARTAVLVISVAAIGVLDYLTGPNVGFSLFYLAPIVWSAWHSNRLTWLTLVALASASWIGAEIAWRGVNLVSLWNGFTRVGIYLSMAWLTSRLRGEHEQLRELNAKLQQMLEEEQVLARTDALTKLPNRRLFIDELRRAVSRSRHSNTPIAVAYMDLDRFKTFNDRYGHVAGDAVLRSVGEVLMAHVRGNDVAARLGGDEFGILLEQCTPQTADITVRRLLENLNTTVNDLAREPVGISIGVAYFECPPLSADAVIDHADAAMYCAKAQGNNRIYVTNIAAEPLPTQQR